MLGWGSQSFFSVCDRLPKDDSLPPVSVFSLVPEVDNIWCLGSLDPGKTHTVKTQV